VRVVTVPDFRATNRARRALERRDGLQVLGSVGYDRTLGIDRRHVVIIAVGSSIVHGAFSENRHLRERHRHLRERATESERG
jgi:hypothetical protein